MKKQLAQSRVACCDACGRPDTFIRMEIRHGDGMELLVCQDPVDCRRHWPAGDDLTRKKV